MNSKEKRRRSRQLALIREIILCLTTLCAVTMALFFMLKYNSEKAANDSTQAELAIYTDPANPYYSTDEVNDLVEQAKDQAYEEGINSAGNSADELLDQIKTDLLTNNSAIKTIRSLYPDEIVLIDSNQFYFLPIDTELKMNSYDLDKFVQDEDGRMTYDDVSKSAHFGIDVSKYQDDINWAKVAKDGVEFAIIRAGIRGYTEGEIFEDDNFEDNIKGALKNNVDVGVYFFTQATSDEEAAEEAKFVLDLIEPYDIEYPVVLDVESVAGSDGRGNAISVEERTQYVKTFCDTVEKAGYDTMIYGNAKSLYLMLDLSELDDYKKWYAGYSDTPYFPYDFSMWQYTEKGKVSGISEEVDLNISFYEPE